MTEGYFSSDVPSVLTSVDLLAIFSLVSKAVWVAVDTGLFKSDVLSTFSRPAADLSNVCQVLSPL